MFNSGPFIMPLKKMRIVDIINGRVAMFGYSVIGLSSLAIKTNISQYTISHNFHSIWLKLGVYGC